MIRIFLIFLFLSVGNAFAQVQKTPDDLISHFFDVFKKEGSDAAIEYFFSTNKYMESSSDKIAEIKDRLKKAIELLQTYYGYEIVSRKTLGESLLMLDCMVKYDRQPIQFTFTLYKPNNEWVFQNIKFDYNLEDDLKALPGKW